MKSAKLMENDSPVEETKEGTIIAHYMSFYVKIKDAVMWL